MSSKVINADELATALSAELQYYDTSLQEQIQKAVDDEAKVLKKEIAATSPVRIGKYKKGWTLSRKYVNAFKYMVVVHNKPRYSIVHLIEHGRGPNGVGAKPHLLKAQERSIKNLEQRIDDIIGSW